MIGQRPLSWNLGNMRNTSAAKLIRVISKLVKQPIRELIADGLLNSMESQNISNYRCQYTTKLVGRKWLAPLYRPLLSTFQVKEKTFIAVRYNKKTVDIEYVETASGESTTYTVKGQEWREKEPYFVLIPPERFRGSLGDVVRLIRQSRKGQKHGRD